ncbi:MAG: hypothetical protein HQK61_02945 [Desulfamplus sp.]|nr:hypothetical protein [Desulfamplus sp.]
MTPEKLKVLEQRFSDYADRYIGKSSNPAPLVLKKEHTMRVCQEIEVLFSSFFQCRPALSTNERDLLVNESDLPVPLDDPDLVPGGRAISINNESFSLDLESLLIARAMALFHDLGRFRQFELYGTFLDKQSVNHACLSIIEIEKHELIDVCTEREKELIKGAIAVHNAAQVPQIEDSELRFFMKLLRDADKLDIWRVVINNYLSPDPRNQEIVNLGLEDHCSCSDQALDAILNHTYVKTDSIKELNDLKLMQISWVFDLNFPVSVKMLAERGYIDQIALTLSVSTDFKTLSDALECVRDYLDRFSCLKTGF